MNPALFLFLLSERSTSNLRPSSASDAMLSVSALAIGLLTRFAPQSTPLTRCGAPCMLYDRGQDSGAEMDEAKVHSLLSRRAELRRAGDYSGADAVRA